MPAYNTGCIFGKIINQGPLLRLARGRNTAQKIVLRAKIVLKLIEGVKKKHIKRHGTTTLFAALNILNGKVIGECMPKHRQEEFLKFLKKINKETPKNLNLHLVVDNYGSHKTQKVKQWLSKHPRFKMHFTPTSASCPGSLNPSTPPIMHKNNVDIVSISGPSGLRFIKGFRDEALRGDWKGFRSSRLSIKYRLIYKIVDKDILVKVVNVTPHGYRRK